MIRRFVPVLAPIPVRILVLAAALAAVTAAGCSREQSASSRAGSVPRIPPTDFAMGLARLEQGNTFGAAFLFEKAVMAHPESLGYAFKLGDTYTLLGADDRDYFEKAAQVYDDLEAVVGVDDERLRTARARLFTAQGQVDPAIEIFKELVSEHEDDCEYWILLGRAQIQKAIALRGAVGLEAQMEQLEIADKTYEHAVELCPDRLDAYWGRAVLMEQNKDYDGLIELYGGLLKRFPDNVDALRQYTYAHYMKRDWAGAAENLEKLLKRDYTLDDHRKYIVCLGKIGRTDEEQEQIKLYKETAPKAEGPVYLTDMDRLRIQLNVNPMTDRAGNLFEDGEYQEAIDLWKEVRGLAEARMDDPEFGDAARDFIVWLDRRIQLAQRKISGEDGSPDDR
jgi:tetratricopeptide (TPR) repeat protein